jgi:hypothetical protein
MARIALAPLGLVMAAGALASCGTRTEKAAAVTAIQLCQDYQANEASSDGRYKSQVLRISGTVQNTGSLDTGSAHVVLACPGYMTVNCGLQNAADAARFQKGTHATLICTGDGKQMGTVALRDCRPEP